MTAALRSGRAVALLMLASGVSGVVSAAWPAFDTRWIFVAAVGCIALLDGLLVGLVSAFAAVACSHLMAFRPVSLALERDAMLVGFGVAATIAARGIRAVAFKPLPAAREPILLTSIATTQVRPSHQDFDSTMDWVPPVATEDLQLAMRESSRQRERADALAEEKEVLENALAGERYKSEAMASDLRALREQLREERNRAQRTEILTAEGEALRQELARERQKSEGLAAERGTLQEQLTEAQLQLEQARALTQDEAVQQILASERQKTDALSAEVRALQEQLLGQRRQVEREWNQKLTSREEELSAIAQDALGSAESRADRLEWERNQLEESVAQLTAQLREARDARDAAHLLIEQLYEDHGIDLSQSQAEVAKAQERIAELERLNSELAAAERAAVQKSRRFELDLRESLGEELSAARAAAQLAAEEVASLQNAVRAAEDQNGQLQNALASALENLANQKLELRDAYEDRLREAAAAAQAARQEAAGLTARIDELESARRQAVEELARGALHEAQLRDASEAAAAASQEAGTLRRRIEELEQSLREREGQVESLKELLQRSTRESDARHAAELAATELRADSASARARELAARIADLERDHATLIERVQSAEVAAVRATEKEAKRSDQLRSASEKLARADFTAQELAAEAKTLRDRTAQLERENEELRLQGQAADSKAREAQAATDELAARAAAAEAAAAETAASLRSTVERLARAEERASEAAVEARAMLARSRELERQNAEQRIHAATLEEQLRQAGAESQRIAARLASAEANVETSRSTVAELQARIAEIESERLQLRQMANDAYAEVAAAETRTNAARVEAASLTARLRESGDRLTGTGQDEAAKSEQLATLQRELVEIRASLGSNQAALAAAVAAGAAAETSAAEARERLTVAQRRIGELEAELLTGAATGADIDALRARIGELEAANEALREAEVAASRSLARAGVDAIAKVAAAEAKAAEAAEATAAAEARIAELQESIARLGAEHDKKLQTIVAHLASDHEADIGQAVMEREEARADLRRMQMRAAQALRENADIRAELDKERAARAALDAEWSRKLETIVAHMATDHETDVGQAVVEREEARAELRTLNSRITALTRTIEHEREEFRQAREKWEKEKKRLLGQVIEDEPHRRILVVHPDTGVRAMAKHVLTADGYEVSTAAEGLEALRMAVTNRPDLILAEAQMPKMDGRELMQMLRSRPETEGVQVLLLNGIRADLLRDPAALSSLRASLATAMSKKG